MKIYVANDHIDFTLYEDYIFINSVNEMPSFNMEYETLLEIKGKVHRFLIARNVFPKDFIPNQKE